MASPGATKFPHRSGPRKRRQRPWLSYWPLSGPYLLSLLLLGILAATFVSAAGYLFSRVGLTSGWLFGILGASIVGSRINVPIGRLGNRPRPEYTDVVAFGVRYRIPVEVRAGGTVIAVNVGGALIPAGLASYLIVADGIWMHALIGTAVVATFVRVIARPVRGVGIVTPSLVPPLIAAGTAIVIGGPAVAALAYIVGTLGTLIGADLLNLRRIGNLGASIASIGGAGTFDGVFLTGIVAVILATL